MIQTWLKKVRAVKRVNKSHFSSSNLVQLCFIFSPIEVYLYPLGIALDIVSACDTCDAIILVIYSSAHNVCRFVLLSTWKLLLRPFWTRSFAPSNGIGSISFHLACSSSTVPGFLLMFSRSKHQITIKCRIIYLSGVGASAGGAISEAWTEPMVGGGQKGSEITPLWHLTLIQYC